MKKLVAAIALQLAALTAAYGQANNSSNWQTPGNQVVGGQVQMCLNASSQAIPCSTPATGAGNAGYPAGSTPVANAATGTTGAVTATLAAAVSQFTYLCNWQVSAAGTVTISPITVAGTLGGSLVFQGITAGGAPFTQVYTPCLRSSAVNTAITITTTADASATAVDVQAAGYQQ